MTISNSTMLKLRKMKVASEIVMAQIAKGEYSREDGFGAEERGKDFKIIYKAVSEAVEEYR